MRHEGAEEVMIGGGGRDQACNLLYQTMRQLASWIFVLLAKSMSSSPDLFYLFFRDNHNLIK